MESYQELNIKNNKFKNLKRIGILGGMGPVASSYILKRLLEIAATEYNAYQDSDYPNIILNSIALPEFDESAVLDNPAIIGLLKKELHNLEKTKPDFIIIACNTVHLLFDQIENSIDIPILNMIEEVTKEVEKFNPKKIGIIASETSISHRLFEKYLKRTHNILLPTILEQSIINNLILSVMHNKYSYRQKSMLNSIIQRMNNEGAERIILGCTELPLILNTNIEENQYPRVIDSSEIICRKSLKIAYNEIKL